MPNYSVCFACLEPLHQNLTHTHDLTRYHNLSMAMMDVSDSEPYSASTAFATVRRIRGACIALSSNADQIFFKGLMVKGTWALVKVSANLCVFSLQPLRNALRRMAAPNNLVPDHIDGSLSFSILTYLKKIKHQVGFAFDKPTLYGLQFT